MTFPLAPAAAHSNPNPRLTGVIKLTGAIRLTGTIRLTGAMLRGGGEILTGGNVNAHQLARNSTPP